MVQNKMIVPSAPPPTASAPKAAAQPQDGGTTFRECMQAATEQKAPEGKTPTEQSPVDTTRPAKEGETTADQPVVTEGTQAGTLLGLLAFVQPAAIQTEAVTILAPAPEVTAITATEAVSPAPIVSAEEGVVADQSAKGTTEPLSTVQEQPKEGMLKQAENSSVQKEGASQQKQADSSVQQAADQKVSMPKEQPKATSTQEAEKAAPTQKQDVSEEVKTEIGKLIREEIAPQQSAHAQASKDIFVPEKPVADVSSPKLTQELAERIFVETNGKSTEFSMQLSPRELGELVIKVVFEGDRAHVSLLCTNTKAAGLLAEHAGGLASMVESSTGLRTSVTIAEDASPFAQQRDAKEGGNGQQQQQQPKNKESMEDFMQQLRLGLWSAEQEI